MRKLPGGWRQEKLGDIVDNYDSRRIPLKGSDRAMRRGPYPYCGANGIIDHVDGFLFDGEYILLAEDGGTWGPGDNSAYIIRGKFWVNNHAHIINARGDVVTNAYLTRVLNYLDLSSHITGTTRGKLTQDSMNNIVVPVPPLDTQGKIVATLDLAEKTKRLRSRANELTQELSQNVFLEMFGDPVRNDKKWPTDNISNLTNVKPTKGSTPTTFGYGWEEEGILFLRSECIKRDGIELHGSQRINKDAHNSMARSKVHPNDILIRITGDVGIACIFPNEMIEANINQHIAIIRLENESRIEREFLVQQLNTDAFREHFMSITRGVTHPHLSLEQIRETRVIMPPMEYQKRFTIAARLIQDQQKYQKESSDKIDGLSTVLAQKSFLGEIFS